jgi:glycosyltransferase involved in cell wall biosynthesis
MRIALFSDTWLPNINGVVTSLLNQIKILKEDGHEVFLFVPRTHANKMEKVPEDITIFEFPGVEFPSYPGYRMSLPKNLGGIAKKYRFDILHSHSPFLQGWICFMIQHIQKAPMVTTYHTHLAEYAGHIFKGVGEEHVKHLLGGFMWAFTKNQYNKYDVIFTPSKIMKRELEDHGLRPVVELANPISSIFLEKQIDIDNKKKKFLESFKIPTNKRILLYVGRISFEKRLEVLLEAFKNLELKYNDIFLVIVGDGPQIGMYKKKSKNFHLKNYIFTGYVQHSQLPIVYQLADVFISPSDTETQGLTFIEAMSQGCPVIAIKARGPADYIVHNHNGFFSKTLNPKEFEGLIENVLANPSKLKTLKQNAINTAESYNYNAFREKLYGGYAEAITTWKKRNKKYR